MILALLACAPKVTPEGAEVPVRRSRRDSAPAEVALPEPVVPDLSGSLSGSPELKVGSNLELTSLTWSHVRFTIEADTASLNTIQSTDALQRHLSADPRWKLHRRSGVLTAEKRVPVDGGWRLPPSGYHEDPDRLWRVAIRFEPQPAGAPWADEGLISTSRAGDPQIKVEGIPLAGEQSGRMATAIVVEAERLAVEIFESAPANDRRITAEALGSVPVELPGVAPDRVSERGFDPAWLSSTHTRTGTPGAALSAIAPGYAEVTAWLNPGGPGWTWLRLLSAEGHPWHDDVVPAWSTERIGWGGDALFYYQAIVPTPEGSAPTTAQIWHLPDGSEVPVKLLEWSL